MRTSIELIRSTPCQVLLLPCQEQLAIRGNMVPSRYLASAPLRRRAGTPCLLISALWHTLAAFHKPIQVGINYGRPCKNAVNRS